MVGQTVGKYRIVSRLGRGGMGTVYKAVDETLDREVAIKCLNADIGEPDLLKRFRAEAITLARLNHPNIATLFELATHDGQFLMVMEYVRGETFDRVLQREGPMTVSRAAQLCAQALDALEHAHRAGVVHRDLKPANLMLTQSGLVKVMDFGLARMVGTEHLTNDGYMVGTPAYMSPEQVLGHDIDGRADLYAMGVVLFRLLTSELPFKAESGVAMVHRQLNDPPTPVREVRSELPDACDEILTRALSKAAEARFQSAEEFRSALTRLDPAIPQTGVSRISAVAPAVDPPAVTLAESDVTLRPTPTPAILSGTPAPEPSVTVVLPHGGNPSLRSPATRRGLEPRAVATIAVAAVLVAGIPVTGLLWWRAHRSPSITAPAATAPLTSSSPPPASAPAALTTNAPVKVGTTPGVSPARPASSTAATNAPPAPDATAPPARPVLATLTFGKIRLLMIEDKKSRDVDAALRLGPDALEIVDGTRTIERAPYQDVISVYYSHSKDPWWMPADGQATPVTKTGSIFGFLRGTPDWITVRTRRNFIPLRVNENDVALLTRELEARTGARVVKIK